MPEIVETAKQLYERLAEERAPYLRRAEKAAECTIPSLFPKEGSSSSTDFETPFQSVGARGLNNLASKLILAIMPPNASFLKFSITDKEKMQIKASGGDDSLLTQIENRLAQHEQIMMRYCEARQIRVTVGEGCKQLLVAGNCLFFLPPKEGGIKLYRLNSYVVERDALGNPFTIVTKETRSYASLPDKIKAILKNDKQYKPEDQIDIYTHVYLQKNRWMSYQEIEGERIPKSEQNYPADKSPWIPVRMVKVDGESYGRGYIEEYQGDLSSLEAGTKALIQYAAVVSRIIFLCNPSGQTLPSKVSKAKTGDFVSGRKEDIQALTLDRYADFQVLKGVTDAIESRLSYAFLLNSAVQRNGERVTAEEIRYVARELEDTLGGVYSILSVELQLPLARRLQAQLQASGDLPSLPDGSVDIQITTGFEALGRGKDLDRLDVFLGYLKNLPSGENYLKVADLLTIIGTALSLDVSSFLKTPEEVAQEQQQAMQMALAQRAASQLANGFAQAQLQNQQGG